MLYVCRCISAGVLAFTTITSSVAAGMECTTEQLTAKTYPFIINIRDTNEFRTQMLVGINAGTTGLNIATWALDSVVLSDVFNSGVKVSISPIPNANYLLQFELDGIAQVRGNVIVNKPYKTNGNTPYLELYDMNSSVIGRQALTPETVVTASWNLDTQYEMPPGTEAGTDMWEVQLPILPPEGATGTLGITASSHVDSALACVQGSCSETQTIPSGNNTATMVARRSGSDVHTNGTITATATLNCP